MHHFRRVKLAWADFLEAVAHEIHMHAENIRNANHEVMQ